VRNIGSNHHSALLGEETSGSGGVRSNCTACRTSKLRVELHADVGDVLALALLHMRVLHALADNTVPALR
jgi:hypothetical protein